ncbi:MAG: flagellar biosynthesis protein FlhF [Lachnospiraceae bacterium]|nr:flagellar biosynthesis protein FlhF [Lachnospiraceae bacterium]MBR5760496.1 flagellar biosynthesis protein FlhF [Lachnospiraceae bacterium]MBR5993962.1 flagellar biosynthesis protein FlhF [Lachnospiraceae bacterium]
MIIKKFQAKTENEAVEAAKKELGNNVVVMNVRNTKKKGLFSFLRPQLVEITVAVEEDSERKEPVKSADARSITEALGKIAPIVERSEKEKESSGIIYDEKPPKTDKVIEARLNSIENLIEEKLVKPEEPVHKEEPSDKKEEDTELKKFFDLLLSTMLDNEVEREYASSIIDETAKVTKPGTPIDVALAGIYQKMILKFGKASVISPAENGPKTVFFVGPTGVGKTTTIAKIASKFSVELKKKVALLTADTYRIAAAEQLRTYANILEVPFRIIYTIEEMESALRDFKNFDYVFVDTAGHSHQNEEQKNVMGSFIHSVDGIVEKEVYLVVSATTKYRDLMSIADAYSTITDYKLIFTKLDETTALGNLLNLKLYTGADLSYITCGQNVPDDIEDFNAQSTVKNLLGGKK